jgi:ParB family chromosome partitioning protein
MDFTGKAFKKNQRSALGRGLSALVSSAAPVAVAPLNAALEVEPSNVADTGFSISAQSDLPPKERGVTFVDIAEIAPNPTQPRFDFSEAEIGELSESIRTLGLLQPILVRPFAGKYQIVAGERRFRAAIRAGLIQVPVLVRELTDRETLEVAIVENVQRQNLNPIEEAKGYQRLMDEFSLTAQEVAERVSKDRATVANAVRILRLPQQVQDLVREGKISVGHAKAILTVKEPSAQINLALKVIAEALSVRTLESIVGREVVLEAPKKALSGREQGRAAQFPEVEERLRNALGTKVTIRRGKQGGTIELHFFSDAELDRLIDRLSNQ